jgi:integrase/recombinase XerD
MSVGRSNALPFRDWPKADQAMWRAAIAEGDILDGAGPCAFWAPNTRNNVRKTYGMWLQWLANGDDLDLVDDPMTRITPDRVADFVADLQDRVASSTVFTYTLNLLMLAQRVAPEHDWSWLTGLKNRLHARVTPARDKTSKIRSSDDLFDLGIHLMDTADGHTCRYNPVAAETRYRDGLMIALLAARPIRLANLANLEIGQHVIRVDNTYWLILEAKEVKNRKHIEVPLPEALTEYVDEYLKRYRPRLLGSAKTNQLWISSQGRPLSQGVIRYHVKRLTEEAFGQSISPHLFRDCAATSVAIRDPKHVRIAAGILGHHNLSTTQDYYDQSRMLEAGRAVQSALIERRRIARREQHRPYKEAP